MSARRRRRDRRLDILNLGFPRDLSHHGIGVSRGELAAQALDLAMQALDLGSGVRIGLCRHLLRRVGSTAERVE